MEDPNFTKMSPDYKKRYRKNYKNKQKKKKIKKIKTKEKVLLIGLQEFCMAVAINEFIRKHPRKT